MSGAQEAEAAMSDEDLAAAWGAEAEADSASAGAEPVQPARVLNQAEIDSLLGFDNGPMDGESRTGMQKIISSGLVSYERLPMLEIVFDRLVRIMSTSLRNFTSDNVEVSIDNILSLRFGDYLNSIPLPAMLAVFKAEEWDNYGLMVVDSAMIYSIVDVLLGGRRGTAAMRIEGRPYTTIERTLVERLIHVVLADLSASFDPLCPVTFRFERLEVNPRFATISRLSNAAVLARLRIDMEDRGGRLELMLPYATLEPVRELLLQQFMGEKFGRDSIWETHLAEELWHTEVDLDVVLDEQVMRLSDVMSLQLGSRIVLNTVPNATVSLRCGSTTLFEGRVGRRKNRVAVRIDSTVMRLPVAGGMSMEWLLEIALIVLLAATLFHALRLERALGLLKRDRAALEDLVASFNSSTRLAEQGIDRLREAADGVGRQISGRIDLASRLKDDLSLLCERSDRQADRLEQLVRAGRNAGPDISYEPAPMPFLTASREVPRAQRDEQPLFSADEISSTSEPNPRLRSQAERDLLKALKMAR